MQSLFYIGLSTTFFLMVGLLMAPAVLRPSRQSQRLLELVQSTREDNRVVRPRERIRGTVLGLAAAFRQKLGLSESAKLRTRLLSAGLRNPRATDVFFSAQLSGAVLGLMLGSLIRTNTVFMALVFGLVGYMAPDVWVDHKIKKRRKQIRRSLPDAIDLLMICVDAGLGLDQALLRVSVELSVSHPEINEEFTQINLEQRAGKPRLEAWQAMADRTQIKEVQNLVSMLVQTDRFGTPILKALSMFSEELRTRRRQKAEEAAAKTKIKILFPLVLCIFPCIFIVLLAPAVLSIGSSLKGLTH
jgi:tight adherence protein C